MKVSDQQALAVRCPVCGAKVGEKCELSIGMPRTEPHRDRRLVAWESLGLSNQASAAFRTRLSPSDYQFRTSVSSTASALSASSIFCLSP